MLPMSSSNHHHHPYIEPSWRTYYDAKRLLRQTEQRLNEARSYAPHVHLSNHYETIDHQNLSSASSSVLTSSSTSSILHHSDQSTLVNGNRSIYPDERLVNGKYQFRGSEALETIRRKISKQKLAAERRAEQLFHSQSDAGHVFESSRPHSNYSTSASLQNLHYSPHRQSSRIAPPPPPPTHLTTSFSSRLSQSQSFPSELDAVLRQSTNSRLSTLRDNDFERQSTTRPITSILPNENYPMSNGRTNQQRSASASNGLAMKYQDLPPSRLLTPTENKYHRRSEQIPVPKSNLIPTDSWRADLINGRKIAQEKAIKKNPTVDVATRRTKADDDDDLLAHSNSRMERMIKATRRDSNALKPSLITTEKTPLKPVPGKIKGEEEKKKPQDHMPSKRSIPDETFPFERQLSDELERNRKKKPVDSVSTHLNNKRTSAFTPVASGFTEQTRQRLLYLLGSSNDNYATSFLEKSSVVERSPSPCSSTLSSSSSSTCSTCSSASSVIHLPPEKQISQASNRSRSEPPVTNGTLPQNGHRHDNLIEWARKLTRDCDVVESKFKYLRPGDRSAFGIHTSASYQHLQFDDGNLRHPTSTLETNSIDKKKPSVTTRSLERSYSANEHRDPLVERVIYRNRAAATIQAAYRGYSVRKSLSNLNEKQRQLFSEFNRRDLHAFDVYPNSGSISYDRHRPLHNSGNVQRKPDIHADGYDNDESTSLSFPSTPTNNEPVKPYSMTVSPIGKDTVAMTHSTTVKPAAGVTTGRRRSSSPPLHPIMSPDNGRPLPTHLNNNHQSVNDTYRISTTNGQDISHDQFSTVEPSTQKNSSAPHASSSNSSSSSVSKKRKSPSPAPPAPPLASSSSPPAQPPTSTIKTMTHSHHQTSQSNPDPSSASAETILTAREKRVRQKFNSDMELQAYEKRLKDIEKKIRLLIKRAIEIFDEKCTTDTQSPISKSKASNENRLRENQDQSSISEDTSSNNSNKRESDSSLLSSSNRQPSGPFIKPVTSDVSDLEKRVRDFKDLLNKKKQELDLLKLRKNKENLRRQEDVLRQQIESYDQQIEALHQQSQSSEQTVPIPSIKLVNDDSSSNVSGSRSNSIKNEAISTKNEVPPLQLDQNDEKPSNENSQDMLDTPHDAQSFSTSIDMPIISELKDQEKRSNQSDGKISEVNEVNHGQPVPIGAETPVDETSRWMIERKNTEEERSGSEPVSSSLSISAPSPLISPETTEALPLPPPPEDLAQGGEEISESMSEIPEIIEQIKSVDRLDNNASPMSKSSEEQSVIQVFGEKSITTTSPDKQEKKVLEDEFPYPPSNLNQTHEISVNENTSRDTSEVGDDGDVENNHDEDEHTVNSERITDVIRDIIRPMIDSSNAVENKEIPDSKLDLSQTTKESSESTTSDELSDEEKHRSTSSQAKDDFDKEIEKAEIEPVLDDRDDILVKEDLKIDIEKIEEDPPADSHDELQRPPVPVEPIKPFVSHSHDEVLELCRHALKILNEQNDDFTERTKINRTIPQKYFDLCPNGENDEVQRSRHAYSRMVFDLCAELLFELHSPALRLTKYPEWQKSQLNPKRFYRLHPPRTSQEVERFVTTKVLEILNLNPRQLNYSKWRMPMLKRRDIEKFELVLDEELRRSEATWINYDDDCLRIKFDLAEHIFEQLMDETLTECFHVVKKRILMSSNNS